MRQWIGSTLVQIMACRLFGAKPLSEPIAGLLWIGLLGINPSEKKKNGTSHSRKCIWKYHLANDNHFYPRTVLAFGYCRCLRLSVSPLVTKFVRAITHYPFKLGSPNLDQNCKRPWLRSLLCCGTIDRDVEGQIELQRQSLPHFELVHAITHHQLKLQFPNLEQKCILTLFRSLPIFGLIEIDLQFNF